MNSSSWKLSIFAFFLRIKIGVCTINRKNVLIGLSTEHSSQRIIGQEVKLNDSRQIIRFCRLIRKESATAVPANLDKNSAKIFRSKLKDWKEQKRVSQF